MTTADVDERWATRLHDLAAEEGVPGAALGVWADGQEVAAAAHGVLNADTGVRATADSLFQIGSITKVWTTTMIMQLVGEGRLSLDTTVAEVLPGVRIGREDAGEQIAIRHLLSHTSGIDGDIFTDTGRGDECVERYVGELGGAAQVFPPGAAYSYCNSGFVLLGRIIEVLDGRIWDASLHERLIGPLGLTQTVTLPEDAIRYRVATGHRERPRQDQAVSVWGLPRSVGPAGLITSSVQGVLAFARLHLDGGVTRDGTRLLSQASAEDMRRQRAEIPGFGDSADAVGLGWRLHRWGDRRIFGHDGGTIGQTAYLRIDPEARLIVCLLTNSPAVAVSVSAAVLGGVRRLRRGHRAAQPRTGGAAGQSRIWNGTRAGTSAPPCGMTCPCATAGCTWSPGSPTTARPSPTRGRTSSTCTPRTAPATTSSSGRTTRQPWSPLVFGRFDDQAPYLFTGGRITPRVE